MAREGPGIRASRWLLVLAFAIAAVLPMLLTRHWILNSDGALYFDLATSIASGHGYAMPDGTPALFRPPGLPLLIDAVWLLTGRSGLAAAAALALAQAAMVAAAMVLASRLAPGLLAAGLTGLLMLAADPVNRGLAGAIRPDGLVALLALVGIILWIDAQRRLDRRLALFAGIAMGLSFAVKQTGLAVVLVPIVAATLQPDRATARLALRAVFGAGAIPAIWYAYLAMQGRFLAGYPAISAAALAAELFLAVLVVSDCRSTALLRHAAHLPLVLRAFGILAGLVVGVVTLGVITTLALADRVEISHRSLVSVLAVTHGGVPGYVLALIAATAVVIALYIGGPWRVVAVALIATVPVSIVAWAFELRASQYGLGFSFVAVLIGGAGALAIESFSAAVARLSRGRWLIVTKLVVGIVAAGAIALTLVLPQMKATTRSLVAARGDQTPLYAAIANVGAWLRENTEPGSSIGFDDERVRAIYWLENATHPMIRTPQLFIAPGRSSEGPWIRTIAWLEVGRLGENPPPVTSPIIHLYAGPEGRYFVALEEHRFLDWLNSSGIGYLIATTDEPLALGDLGDMKPYLNSLSGLRLVHVEGNGTIAIYEVTGSVAPMPTGLWTTAASISLFSREVGSTVDEATRFLNPYGRTGQ